jgi:hypothetical protein
MNYPRLAVLCGLIFSLCCLAFAQQSSSSQGIMDLQKIEKNGRIAGLRDDLVWFRLNPSVLDDKMVMRYFIALNNCDSRTILKEMDSEFDAPKLTAFYKAKAPEILNQVPLWIGYSGGAYLGEYDTAAKAFPLTDATGKKQPITLASFSLNPDRTALNYSCGNALLALRNDPGSMFLGIGYIVTVPTTTFTALSVDEETAHQYVLGRGIGRAGGGRPVTILIDFDILPQTPELVQRPRKGSGSDVRFQAKLSKITVLAGFPLKPMGTLIP